MGRKYRIRPRFYFIMIIILALMLLIFMVEEHSIFDVDEQKGPMKEYIEITKHNLYLVYENGLTLRIPTDVFIQRDKRIEDIVKKKNYKELLSRINYILPEKISKYKVSKKFKNTDEEIKDIPLIKISNNKYIDSFLLTKLFTKIKTDKIKTNHSDIIVDILNANGKNGYATKTGKALKDKFGYKFTAANFEEKTDYTYIINKDLTDEEIKEIILKLKEKYIKIKKDVKVSTLASAVLILGKDVGNLTKIILISKGHYDKSLYKSLQKYGYKNLKVMITKNNIKDSVIQYNKEDYYTAYKAAKLLHINNLKEDSHLKNTLKIYKKGDK